MPLAIIGLVCPEARVKFKNIDFRAKADFACYCKEERGEETATSRPLVV
jgi:hypothetical protein